MRKCLLLIVFVLLLTACSFPGQKEQKLFELFKGTQALSFSFLKGLPPNEVYSPEEGQTTAFQAAIEMANLGSQDIKEGYFVLAVEKNYMKISKWDTDSEITPVGAAGERIFFSLEGRSQVNPIGGKELFTVNLEALSIDKQSTQHTSAITLTACYDYVTEVSKDICIDTDIYNIRPAEKTCRAEDITISGGQGAPVEVTKIEENIQPSESYVRPQFIIHIRNSGSGDVIDKDRISDACSASPLSYDYIDVVNIEEVKFSSFSSKNNQIECSPDKIKLKNGEGKTRCTLKPGLLSSSEVTSYTTPLFIKLNYGYMQSASKEISVKNIMA